ncbi:DUF7345 domain-containing protein [Halorarius litoreus]|uniref:DUF7345 domain-containing protein n=1 Tax=Halorarius litoreus TaxID=2962676 RepID=UPI0020CF5766|nr:hypothetical protein [Halorarius litoreus]
MRRLVAAVLALCTVGVVLASAVVPVAAVHTTGHSFTVQLAENGDATVVVEDRYNLSNESEAAAFEAIASNESRQQQHRQQVAARLDRGASLAADASGREVQSGEVTIEVTETNGTGIVRVQGSWSNVAAVNTKFNILELRQPFQSGFEVNRTLVVAGPDAYTRVSTTPAPSRALKSSAYWGQDADLSAFFIRFEGPTTATVSASGGGSQQGTATVAPITSEGLAAFALAAAVALVPVVLLVVGFGRVGR